MAAAPKKVSKTKLAREAAVAVITKAGEPVEMATIIEKVLAQKAVRDAAIPKGTVSAQVNFALAESPARIQRVGRGLYAAVGVKVGSDSKVVEPS